MTGSQYGAGGFKAVGPPITGAALLRCTAPNASRPHPIPAARRWRARVRLRRTSPSPTPTIACCYHPCLRQARCPLTHALVLGLRHLAAAWGRTRRSNGGPALAKGEVRRRRCVCQHFCWWLGVCERRNTVLVVGAPLPDRAPYRFRVAAPLLRSDRTGQARRPTLRNSAPSP